MFFGGNEEDQDFLAAGGSKLASLFGGEQSSSQGNESLKYQAPKEPRKKTDVTPQTSAAAPSTLFAAAVFAYKFVDGKYASQGKLGAAIIGNHSTQEYRILLYVSKQQQVSYATISPTFVFTVAANNYASFYDDTRQNWSVMFDNQEAAIQFSQHIALAKANTANKMDSVLVQDTVIGTGAVLENGDAVEARYTAWLMHDHSFGQEFENNTKAEKFLRLKLGKGKVIKGIDEGLLGAKNQTRRLLIVPPSLGYGSSDKGNVPANSTLIYDMEIVRIKYGREREGTEAVQPDPIPAHAPTPAAKSKEEKESSRESSVRSSRETTPVEEEKPVEETGKAKLLSRIAKMGQPILPGMTGSAIDEGAGDTSAAIPVETPSASHGKPNIPAKPSSGPPTPQATTAIPFSAPQPQPAQPQPVYHPQYQHPMQAPVMMGQPEMYNSSIPPGGNQVSVFQPQMPVYPGQYGAMQYGAPMYPAAAPPPVPTPQPTAPAAMDPGMAVVTSEARQQNTEVRLTLGRLMDKVDRISEKVENFHSSQNQVSLVGSYGNSMPNMDTQTLLQSITRIIQENERLKQEVLEKGARVESQNDKIAQLLQRNQQYLEQSNSILEQTSDSYKTKAVENQSKVLSLEQEKVALVGQLGQVTGQLSSLQLELNTLRQSESDLRRQLESAVNNESQTKEQLSTVRLQLLGEQVSEFTSKLKDDCVKIEYN